MSYDVLIEWQAENKIIKMMFLLEDVTLKDKLHPHISNIQEVLCET